MKVLWRNADGAMQGRRAFAEGLAPLVTSDGFALGTLCLLDQKPRTVDATDLDLLASLASNATSVIDREPNALAHAQYAIAELSDRIRFAIAEEDDATVAVLDEELRRFEAKLKPHWRSGGPIGCA